jgi:hypothetical protein
MYSFKRLSRLYPTHILIGGFYAPFIKGLPTLQEIAKAKESTLDGRYPDRNIIEVTWRMKTNIWQDDRRSTKAGLQTNSMYLCRFRSRSGRWNPSQKYNGGLKSTISNSV